jgi:hypothetical protein
VLPSVPGEPSLVLLPSLPPSSLEGAALGSSPTHALIAAVLTPIAKTPKITPLRSAPRCRRNHRVEAIASLLRLSDLSIASHANNTRSVYDQART